MTATELAYKLREEPCQDSLSFCYNKTIQEAWEQCARPDWMLYPIERYFTERTIIRVKYEMIRPYFRHNPYSGQMIQRFFDGTLSLEGLIDSAALLEGSECNIYTAVVTRDMSTSAAATHYLIWHAWHTKHKRTDGCVKDEMKKMADRIRDQIPYYLLSQQIKNKS
jgi:hypothetical protein